MSVELRVGLYVRVSTDKQEVDNQLLQLREYCAQIGHLVVGEYVDVISGKETKRQGYDEMFLHVHQARFDMILFWDLSRFSRAGTLYTLQKLKELDNAGVEWESFQEPYFRSAGQFKDVVISVISTVARIEREKISERTKAGLERARKAGAPIGKRGRDRKRRRSRSDRGLKRGPYQKGDGV